METSPKTSSETGQDAVDFIRREHCFPQYQDGDVCIVLNADQCYLLHAKVLRDMSPILACHLTEEKSVVLTPEAVTRGATIRWRLNLTGTETNSPVFVPREVNDQDSSLDEFGPRGYDEDGDTTNPLYLVYDNLLRSFYHEELVLNQESLATILHDCLVSEPFDSCITRSSEYFS